MSQRFAGEHIWIIGASEGIGRALAERLAQQGARLCLSARSEETLQQVASTLHGTDHRILPVDIGKMEALHQAVETLEQAWHQLDRVIILAAIYDPSPIATIDIDKAATLIDINLVGPMRVVHAILPWMQNHGRGQIAITASVAGYVGLPEGQPYSASKAGLINYTESLKAELATDNIDVKLINPGFVETRLTAKNDFTMPAIQTPEAAAKAIANGLKQSGFEIHFPKRFTRILKLLRLMPYGLYFRLAKRM